MTTEYILKCRDYQKNSNLLLSRYRPLIRFLGMLKQSCNHLDYVYNMPAALPE
jgi:hypothetical protein